MLLLTADLALQTGRLSFKIIEVATQFGAAFTELAQTPIAGGNGLLGFLEAVGSFGSVGFALGQFLAKAFDAPLQIAQFSLLLGSHILPEVSMTCQRVIIINRGRLVAVDTPENLTAKLQKSSRLLVQVEGPATEVVRALGTVSGVQTVKQESVGPTKVVTCTVESQKDRDVRKDIAATVVQGRWGLLELRPVDLTLEDVFVRLVTEEKESTE